MGLFKKIKEKLFGKSVAQSEKYVVGLEKSRKALPELYSELKWLKETADREQVDYEEIIPIKVEQDENLMPCGSGFGL